ncbi:MAG: DinB family protein [Ginsengibacter sp.]
MSINTSLLGELKNESANTKKILERIPTEKLDWQPHEKSMTMGALATHIANLPVWIGRILSADGFDFASSGSVGKKETTQAILELFTQRIDEAEKALTAATSDEMFKGLWTVSRNNQILYQLPKMVAIRSFAFSHVYHHRGQLSVYLRLLDIPVPGMYGPSADEK